MPNSVRDLKQILTDVEDAGRNIYYAMSFLRRGHPAAANLELALDFLGIRSPKDVGLSDRVLTLHSEEADVDN